MQPATKGRNAAFTRAEGRQFGFTVGAAFLVLALISSWRGHDTARVVLGVLGASLLLAGLVAPTRLGPVNRAWMALAHAISKVTTPIFMGLVYFVVIMPAGVVMRLFGRNPLRHRAIQDSYWASHTNSPRDGMRHQF